jgi:hypothetical protein
MYSETVPGETPTTPMPLFMAAIVPMWMTSNEKMGEREEKKKCHEDNISKLN